MRMGRGQSCCEPSCCSCCCCCCCCCCCPCRSSRSVVRRLDGVGDDGHDYAFIMLLVMFVAVCLDLGCLFHVANGRRVWRRWWVVLTWYLVILELSGSGLRRRWGWVALTRYRAVRAWFDSGCVGEHDFMRSELVAVLFVLNNGSRGWVLLTLGCLDLSRYLFLPLCLPFLLFCPC